MNCSHLTQQCSKNIPHYTKNSYHPKAKDQYNISEICCNHQIMLNTIAYADLEDHKGRSTQDNSSIITQTIVDVERCMMSSKIAHLLNRLLRNKQSNCGPTK
ncbi:hypothetical protein O181_110003 [Austropuccinia psidii MF-1]|uniref:Uncharacterized protein n=1 Tax=Austropuccinia psidii MF-1 TaxID=1389203 RepID=A0A9Q3PQD1_9BASI|nr:hypothetical protein [Austropuccinia psidii MF-1]